MLCWLMWAGPYAGLVAITNGSAGALQVLADIYDAYSISCPTADLCAVAGYATGGIGPRSSGSGAAPGQDRCFANSGRRHNVP